MNWCGVLAVAFFALVVQHQPVEAAGPPPQQQQQQSAGFLTTVAVPGMTPVRLYAEDYGRGRTLLLVHGLGASGYMWRRMVPDLARANRVIVLDLKGFGRSDKPMDTAYSPLDQARLVNAFIRQRGLRDVTIVGHSLGGVIGLLAAIDDSGQPTRRITRLVTMNAPALPQMASPAVRFLRTQVLPYVALNLAPAEVPAAFGLFSESVTMGHLRRQDIEAYAAPLREPGGPHALIETARQIAPVDPNAVVSAYSRVRIPVLVIGCRADQTVPIATAVELSRRLPRGRLAVLEGCDHIPPEQMPADVVRLLNAFR